MEMQRPCQDISHAHGSDMKRGSQFGEQDTHLLLGSLLFGPDVGIVLCQSSSHGNLVIMQLLSFLSLQSHADFCSAGMQLSGCTMHAPEASLHGSNLADAGSDIRNAQMQYS